MTEKFKDYLTGAQFTVYTDNNPVAHLQTARLGAVEQRWVAQLASFDYDIKYRSGKSNVNADALSRFPANPLTTDASDPELEMESAPVTAAVELTPEGGEEELASSEWEELQAGDPDIQAVKRYVETQVTPPRSERQTLSSIAQRLLQQRKRLTVKSNLLCRKMMDPRSHEVCFQIVCPSTRSHEVWKKIHEAAAHAGVERTLSRIRQQFYWPSMEGEVRRFHLGCVACSLQREKVEPRAPLNPMTVSYP